MVEQADAMAQAAVARNSAMVDGVKAIVKAMAAIDPEAAGHVALEYGLIIAGMKIEAAAMAASMPKAQ